MLPWRADFLSRVEPRFDRAAAWMLVALAASVPLGSALSNVLGVTTLVLMLLAGGYRVRWQRIRNHPFARATLVLCALIALGVSYSQAPDEELRRALAKYARLLYALLAIVLLCDWRWQRRALLAWVGTMLLTLLLSYIDSLWSLPFSRATREAAEGDHYIFKHHITQNVMMSVFVVAALLLAAEAWLRRPRARGLVLLWLGVAIAAVVNIMYLVLGRAGYVTLFVNVLIVLTVASLRERRLIVGAVVAFSALLLAAGSSSELRERMALAFNEAQSASEQAQFTSIGQRLEFASKSLTLIRERPILGWGTGDYAQQFCRVASSEEWCALGAYNPHNQFLFLAVQFGLLGLLAYIGWLASAAWCARRLPPGPQLMTLVVLATLCVHSLIDSPLYIVTEGTWYPLMLGILLANTHQPPPPPGVAPEPMTISPPRRG